MIDVDGAGVWLGDPHTTLGLVTATDAQVTRVKSAQLTAGAGPCIDAFATRERVVCDDLSSETRWPDDVSAAIENGYVVNVRNLDESRTLSEQLTHALDSRVVIEQAKGLIAGRHGIDVDEAFDLLRGQARRDQRSLHGLCRQVVTSGTGS